MRKTDSALQRQVLDELRWDPRVDEAEVGVEVHQGVVVLSGTVTSYSQRAAAEAAAHRVRGVLDVVNELQVVLPGQYVRTDEALAHAVRHTLEWDVDLPADRIHTTVSGGVVTLEGTVDYAHQREDAARAVRRLKGVRGVVNRLTVMGPAVDAEHIRHAIRAALERRADRTARHIDVTVAAGEVTLAGPVHSWAEREAVLGAARFTPGVHAVIDRLYVDWYG